MSLEKILIIDDEPIVCKALREILPKKRFTVATAGMIAEAEATLAREKFDLIFCDVRLPDGSGQDFLERMMTATEPPLVVMMTGYGSIESAVSCMRAGAFDYLLKPFTPDIIEVLVKKAESFGQLVKVNRILSESGDEGDLLGDSPVLRRLLANSTIRGRIIDPEGNLVVDSRFLYGGGDIIQSDLPQRDSASRNFLVRWWNAGYDWFFAYDYPQQKEYSLDNGKDFPEVAAALNGAVVSVVRLDEKRDIIVLFTGFLVSTLSLIHISEPTRPY